VNTPHLHSRELKMRTHFEVRTFVWLFLVLLFSIPHTAFATEPVTIGAVLVSDALPMSMPLFSDSLDIGEVLESDHIKRNTFRPSAGDALMWFAHTKSAFKSVKLTDNTIELPFPSKAKQPYIAYSAFYLTNTRYQSVTFKITSELPLGLFINGEKKYLQPTAGDETHTETVELNRGKHLVLVKAMLPGDGNATDIEHSVSMEITPQYDHTVDADTTPTRELDRYDDLRYIKTFLTSPSHLMDHSRRLFLDRGKWMTPPRGHGSSSGIRKNVRES